MKDRRLPFMIYLLALLTLISCGISLWHNDIYQDGAWANAQWLGQDAVTLFLALPLLLLAYVRGFGREHPEWQIVCAGILLYFTYTYAFYMFVAKLTFLYLFHLPIFGLATIGLVRVLIRLTGQGRGYRSESKGISRAVIAYLCLISLMLAFIWLSDIFAHLTVPGHRSDTPDGEPPLIIYSLDLALIIPLMLAAAIQLFRNRSGLLAGIMLTKTSTLGFALMVMALSMYLQDLNPDYFLMLLWCVIGLLGSLLTLLYLRQLEVKKG